MASSVRPVTFIAVNASKDDISKDDELWFGVEDFHAWLTEDVLLEKSEYPRQLLLLNEVSRYKDEVENGGHWQYTRNSRSDKTMVAELQQGLDMVGASEALEIFTDFMHALEADHEATSRLDSPEFGYPPAFAKVADDAFFSLGSRSHLVAKAAAWIRSYPTLRLLDAQGWQEMCQQVIAGNPELPQRQKKREERRQKAMDADPRVQLAKFLCASASRKFVKLTTMDTNEGTRRFFMVTSSGPAHMTAFADRAVLHDTDSGEELARVVFSS